MTDVVEALTYYGHREKLRIVGKEDALEELNLAALKIAREVVDETGSLFAGNICNCTAVLPHLTPSHLSFNRSSTLLIVFLFSKRSQPVGGCQPER